MTINQVGTGVLMYKQGAKMALNHSPEFVNLSVAKAVLYTSNIYRQETTFLVYCSFLMLKSPIMTAVDNKLCDIFHFQYT